jgi:hypothetical protein
MIIFFFLHNLDRQNNTSVKRAFYGDKRHFQQYFSYIVAVSFIVEETGENHRPSVNHWKIKINVKHNKIKF